MVTIKEFFSKQRVASNLGSNVYSPNLMKEDILTPHKRMSRVLDILENRPGAINALKKFINYVVGNMTFKSADEKTSTFLNSWLDQRPNIKETVFEFAYLLAGCGSSYIEPTFNEMENGDTILDNFFTQPDPSLIWYNFNAINKGNDDEYWLLEVPIEIRFFKGMKPQWKPVYYLNGGYIAKQRIHCIALHKDKLVHKKIGWSRDGYYGQGFLSSAVDDNDIISEILKNWALVAKYKALGKKIIGVYNQNGDPVDMGELDDIENKFSNMSEEDSIFINKKFQSEALSFVGENDDMATTMDFLQRDMGSSIIPNYLSPFSQDNALATASESKSPFMLELLSFQNTLVKFFNELIIDNLKKQYKFISDDATIDFGRPDIYSKDEKFQMMSQLYNNVSCTMNELRESAGLLPVENGDVWPSEVPLDNRRVTEEDITEKKSVEEK